MTVGLLALIDYERIGRAVHEWVGAGMLALFVFAGYWLARLAQSVGKARKM